MAKISNGRLERIAVGAVKAEANKPSSFLKADIPEGDKGISFDGEIQVFKDETETVESLVGKVPVQVKGTGVNKFSSKNRTFSLEIEHFRNYYNSNGAILFVVEILNTGDSKIFYKQLLPKELKQIIHYYGDVKKQKKKTVTLRPLSETSLDRVCRIFINESKKQPTMLIESEAFVESDFTSFSLSSLTFNPAKEATSNIFDHDFTVYGTKEKLTIPLHLARIHSVGMKVAETVNIGDKQYKLNMKITNEASQIILFIENSLEMIYNEKNNKFNYAIRRFDSLATQLKILPFLIDLLSGRNIHFREASITVGKFNIDDKDFLKGLEHLYSTFLKLEKVFQNMGIDKETKIKHKEGDFGKLISDIESLVHAILDKNFNRLNIKEPDSGKFTSFSLGDIRLIFFYNPDSETKLIDAFSEEVLNMDVRLSVEGENFPHSPYTLMNDLALAYGANCDFDIIKESFNQFDPFANEHAFNQTNHFCLQSLNAYDMSNNKKILDLAEHIYGKYSFDSLKLSNTSSLIVTVNSLQIRKRKDGSLTDEEYKKLMDLKTSSKDDLETQFCISVLLESKKEAELTFQQFEEERQEFYKGLPIYFLYKKLLEQ
ncbi:hypothetical protein J2S09_004088 [Bacillus fengqiuensis]|nr:hypothetical protein [Bacillus fengqiuensis]